MEEEIKEDKRMNMIAYFLMTLLIIGFLYIVVIKESEGESEEFAKCLSEKGLVMYGTEWCSHCKDQKKLFRGNFKEINYVDCDLNEEICLREEIEGYPTWKLNGDTFSGTQSLERLSEISGCELE